MERNNLKETTCFRQDQGYFMIKILRMNPTCFGLRELEGVSPFFLLMLWIQTPAVEQCFDELYQLPLPTARFAPATKKSLFLSKSCYNQNNGHSQKYDSAFLRSFWFTVCSSIFRPRADAVFSLSPPFFGTGRTLSDLKDIYLLVPQNKLPCIVTSRRCHFGGGLDIKKAESYYSVRHWNYACKK